MNVVHQASEVGVSGRPVCGAIGMFDGVHLGHQRVLRRTIEDARQSDAVAVAITFDQHPSRVVAPERTPPLIQTVSQRLRAIAAVGVDTLLLLHFDRAFSRKSGEEFVLGLHSDFQCMQSVNIGRNFTFGYQRSGNVALLKALGARLGFVVNDIPPVLCQGQVVSSTRCREAIQAGDLKLASEMLGRPYSVAGVVVPGERLGRKLGFPTANLDVPGLVLPPRGVYIGGVQLAQERRPALMNIGVRPTLNGREPQLRVEVHLLDFEADLYGQEVEFTFANWLRAEEKFSSLDALKTQIEKDVLAARQTLT
jgi:riboflavin kinase / FMN adenylyltransferase